MVKTERDAQTIYYSLDGHHVAAVLSVLRDLYCPPDPDTEPATPEHAASA